MCLVCVCMCVRAKKLSSLLILHSEIEGKHAEKAQYVAELNEEVILLCGASFTVLIPLQISRQQNMKAKAEAQYNEMMEKIQANRRAEEALVNGVQCMLLRLLQSVCSD